MCAAPGRQRLPLFLSVVLSTSYSPYTAHISAYCLVINKSYSCDLKHKAYLTRPDYCCFFLRNRMQLNIGGKHKSFDSEEVKSLHWELILAQSAEVGNYHQMEAFTKIINMCNSLLLSKGLYLAEDHP